VTNIYDVLSKIQTKATANLEKTVAEELKKEDPPIVEGKAFLEAKIPTVVKAKFKQKLNEDTKRNDGGSGSRSNK
jgi:hypothetical protein|tara:strand:- start:41 stop:265 length:225 start_codon:yes stop_codon:yes gene_type:complete